MRRTPFETGKDAVMVAYAAQAELGCFLALGWPLPMHVLDLYAEFRVATNGTGKHASLLWCARVLESAPHRGEPRGSMIDRVLRGELERR